MDKEKLGKIYIKNKELNKLLELFSFTEIYSYVGSSGTNEIYNVSATEKMSFDYKEVYKRIDEIISDISSIYKGEL